MSQLAVIAEHGNLPLLFCPTPDASRRHVEFLTVNINNPHTRLTYMIATRRFVQWCDSRGLLRLEAIEPYQIAGFISQLRGEVAAPP